MKTQFCSLVSAALILTSPALACQPNADDVYDDVRSQAVSIATATVSTVDFDSSENATCWRVEYSAAKFLHGTGPEAFSVTTCRDRAYQTDELAEYQEAFEELGFTPDAEVLVGLVHLNEAAAELRYATPTCWGPLHINLDRLSDDKRAGLLQRLKDQMKDAE